MYKRICVLIIAIVLASTTANGETFKDWIEQDFRPEPPQTVGFKESSNWTTWNKIAFGAAIGGQAADVITSSDVFDKGCIEANPIFGGENVGLMILAKVGLLGVSYWVIENHVAPEEQPATRNWVYGIYSVLGMGIAVHNSSLDCN